MTPGSLSVNADTTRTVAVDVAVIYLRVTRALEEAVTCQLRLIRHLHDVAFFNENQAFFAFRLLLSKVSHYNYSLHHFPLILFLNVLPDVLKSTVAHILKPTRKILICLL